MADLEADVPEQIKHLLDYLGGIGRNVSAIFIVEEHDVDVAEWIELPTSTSTQRDDRQRGSGGPFTLLGKAHGRLENVL